MRKQQIIYRPQLFAAARMEAMQVVDFYNRGGNAKNPQLDSDIRQLGLSETQKHALVAFMLALTDNRVRTQAAPFDHPSLSIPNGLDLPATGASGGPALQPFLSLDQFVH